MKVKKASKAKAEPKAKEPEHAGSVCLTLPPGVAVQVISGLRSGIVHMLEKVSENWYGPAERRNVIVGVEVLEELADQMQEAVNLTQPDDDDCVDDDEY